MAPTAPASTRVFVQNLPPQCGVKELRAHFGAYEVTDVKIPKKKGAKGGCRGIAFVGFRTAEDASAAVARLDKAFWRTSKLRISNAEQRKRDAPPAAEADVDAPPPTKKARTAPEPSEPRPNAKQTRRERFYELMGAGANASRDAFDATPAREEEEEEEEEEEGAEADDASDDDSAVDIEALVAPTPEKDAAAFDDGLDDLAYLRTKAKEAEEEEEEKEDEDEEDEDEDEEEEEEKEEEEEEEEEDDDEAGARLYVANLPYDASEGEIEDLFAAYGTVSEVHAPLHKETRQPLGFAFVTFVLPSAADDAAAALDGASFMGRALSVVAAAKQKKRGKERAPRTFSERREMERKKKALSGHGHGELLRGHVRSDAVAAVAAKGLGAAKGDLFKAASSETAVNLALAEAAVQGETSAYFKEAGYDFDTAAKSRVGVLVKNLPADATKADLETLFAPHGALARVLLAPAKTTAIVEFEEPSEARTAFKRLAYRRFKHGPLYLDWAPASSPSAIAPKSPPTKATVAADDDDDTEVVLGATVFVKNLNFKTTPQGLKAHFAGLGLRACSLPPANRAGHANRGYGFLEFESKDAASEALGRSKKPLDGHVLGLELSTKKGLGPDPDRRKKASKTKLVVRNLAFAVVANDVKQLFEAFGQLKKVRLPKRFDGRHRGFAFVDFANPRDADTAKAALKSAHLYGRHLVIEWADPDEAAPRDS